MYVSYCVVLYSVEHVFEVIVEGVRGLPQLDNTVWGEADCFVQYHFPSQSQPRTSAGVTVTPVGPVLTPHQTPTTLCMPDPTFHDVSRHRLQLPRGTPVQRELLTACAGVGGGAGGIPFEVWFRYYYPNIRDHVVAKSTLPLAKLCAMVTMQRRGEPSVQTFSLPLRLQDPDQESLIKEQITKLQDAGLVDVTINYRHSVVQGHGSAPRVREMGGPQVCLSVGVIRACGLKSAASSLAKFDSSLQYASEVGVNAYIKMELSFLSKQDVRMTQTVARSFAPEFSHHVDFPCPLLFDEQESDNLSLAEALESAEMTLQVWHQVPGFRPECVANVVPVADGTQEGISSQRRFAPTGDVLLGTTTVPLHSLLTHRTGIQGWYPLTTPTPGWGKQPTQPPSNTTAESPKSLGRSGLERVGGGLELSIKFPHQGDRDRVMEAGRRVGWSPDVDLEGTEEVLEEEEEGGATGSHSADINVNIDSAWFPVHAALRPGQNALDSAAKAYIRYKFYDKGSVCSKLCYVDVNDENNIKADFKHSHRFHAAFSQPLAWYLREERLEVQLWVSYNRELSSEETSHTRPRQRDKLIGCAYVDMSALCDKRIKQHRISGLYPLFRPGSIDLGGSCMRVHLSLKHLHSGSTHQQEWSEEAEHLPSSSRQTRPLPSRPSHQDVATDPEEAARRIEEERRRQGEEDERRKMLEPVLMGVAVERAMHLPSVPVANRMDDGLPSCYVTFQQADGAPVHTDTVPDSDQPVWGFEHEVKISAEVLDRQNFIFKVWHQAGSERDMNSDRMLGFASVDLAPLLAGFRSLNGWYNILDFSGHCQGQIKISIVPRESVSPLKRSPKQKTTPNTSAIFAQGFPLVPFATFSHQHQGSKQSPRESSEPTGRQPPPPKSTHPQSLNHYTEHLQNVRKFHEDLHSKLKVHQQGWTTAEKRVDPGRGSREVSSIGFDNRSQGPTAVSSSFLMTNLRKNLEELDSMNQGLQQRLAAQAPRMRIHDEEQPAPKDPLGKTGDHQSVDARKPQEGISYRRTSDEDILEKVRQDLRQERSLEDEDGHNGDWYGQDIDGRGQDIDGRGQDIDGRGQDIDGRGHDENSHGYDDGHGQEKNGRGHDEFGHSPDKDAAVPLYESDWEDDVQFRDEDDVIVPKPLNDVSSAYFSNAVRPDTLRTDLTLDPSRELQYNLQEAETDSVRTGRSQGNYESWEEEEDFRSLETEGQRTVAIRHASSAQEAEEEYLEDRGLGNQVWQSDAAGNLPVDSNESERHADVKWNHSDGDRDADSNNDVNQEISAEVNNDHAVRTHRSGDDHHRHYTSAMSDARHYTSAMSDAVITQRDDGITQRDDGNALRMESEPHGESSVDTMTGEVFADALNLNQDAAGTEDGNHSRLRDVDTNPWIAQSNECQTGVITGDKYTSVTQGNETQVKGQSQVDLDVVLGSEEGGSSERTSGTSVHGGRDEDGRGSVLSTDGESADITIDPEQTERQIVQESKRRTLPDKPQPVLAKSAPVQMPNFFLPAHDLEASMRALHTVTSILPRSQPRPVHSDQMSDSRPTDAARDLTQRLASKHLSGRAQAARPTLKHSHRLPTAEEAKRIAKIFASRLTES